MEAFLISRFGFGFEAAASVMDCRQFVMRYSFSHANARGWTAIGSLRGVEASGENPGPLDRIRGKGPGRQDDAWVQLGSREWMQAFVYDPMETNILLAI